MEFGACSSVHNSAQFLNFSPVKSNFQRPTGYSQLSSASFRFPTSVSSRGCPCKAILNETAGTAGKVKKMVGAHSGGLELSGLTALSPLDGRYWGKVKELSPYMSEYGLIYYRVLVELSQIPEVTEVPNISEEAKSYLQELVDEFSMVP